MSSLMVEQKGSLFQVISLNRKEGEGAWAGQYVSTNDSMEWSFTLVIYFLLNFFDAGPHCIGQADLTVAILLPPLPGVKVIHRHVLLLTYSFQ